MTDEIKPGGEMFWFVEVDDILTTDDNKRILVREIYKTTLKGLDLATEETVFLSREFINQHTRLKKGKR